MAPAEPAPRPLHWGLLAAGGAVSLWAFFLALDWLLHKAPEPIGSRADLFSEGARATLKLTAVSGALGLAVGVLAGLAKLSRRVLLRGSAESFIWLMRGTPLLVQILFAYYGLPSLFPALKLDEFAACAIALALNVGAYNAEVIRAGIQAIPRGQTEAAQSLGLSGFQTMRWIVLPQALRIVIPPLINNVVALLKDSSLASSIGLLELALAGNRVSSETFRPVPVLATVAAVYLALTSGITAWTWALEKRMKRS